MKQKIKTEAAGSPTLSAEASKKLFGIDLSDQQKQALVREANR